MGYENSNETDLKIEFNQQTQIDNNVTAIGKEEIKSEENTSISDNK